MFLGALEELPEGQKWKTMKHNGPKFPPEYNTLPKNVLLHYDGAPFPLEPAAEEVAGFYAVMLKTDYIAKAQFNKNFFGDWQKTMTAAEKAKLADLTKCDFTRMQAHFEKLSEARKNAPKEEKKARKAKEDAINENYTKATLDKTEQKVGNYTLEPPGLFRGRGEHPMMGKLKQRIRAEDVTINIGILSEAPTPPEGTKWAEVKSDNTVTWMAAWRENSKRPFLGAHIRTSRPFIIAALPNQLRCALPPPHTHTPHARSLAAPIIPSQLRAGTST